MGQRRRSPGAAERGCGAEGAAGGGRGRLAESWRRLSSRRGSAKRGGPSAPAPPVSARDRHRDRHRDRERERGSSVRAPRGSGCRVGVVLRNLLHSGRKNRPAVALRLTLQLQQVHVSGFAVGLCACVPVCVFAATLRAAAGRAAARLPEPAAAAAKSRREPWASAVQLRGRWQVWKAKDSKAGRLKRRAWEPEVFFLGRCLAWWCGRLQPARWDVSVFEEDGQTS